MSAEAAAINSFWSLLFKAVPAARQNSPNVGVETEVGCATWEILVAVLRLELEQKGAAWMVFQPEGHPVDIAALVHREISIVTVLPQAQVLDAVPEHEYPPLVSVDTPS